MKTTDKLIHLNELHRALGLKEFKSWKSSVAKLDALLAKRQAEVDAAVEAKAPVAEALAPKITMPTEIALMLARLNRQYDVMGKKRLTTWTGTRDELAAAITKAKFDHKEMMDAERASIRAKNEPAPKAPEVKAPKTMKKLKAKAKEIEANKTSPLPELCNELNINAKVARAYLRKTQNIWQNLSRADLKKILVARFKK